MASPAQPTADLSHLPKADGSATFSYSGFSVVAAVNGPVEAQRRDEHAFEALVDVIVRPAAGVGGTRERHLESILQSALRQLILIRNYPRCMIQVTLQVAQTPENDYVNAKLVQPQINLSIIPALFHAAVLGLLTAAIPLKTIATATVVAIADGDIKDVMVEPSPVQVAGAKSIHALCFTSQNELLFAESEGSFTVDEWTNILKVGEETCCRPQQSGFDTTMAGNELESTSIKDFIRSVLATKTAADLHWK